MLTIIAASIVIMTTLVIAGLPLAAVTAKGIAGEESRKGPLTTALAIIFGFSFSALASTLSYGLLGIDTYFYVFFFLVFLSWTILILAKRTNNLKALRDWCKIDLLLIIPVLVIVYGTRGQWFGINSPGIRAGIRGTDLSQNLMAAESARTIPGNNWFSQSDWLNSFLGQPNLRKSIYEVFRLPSFRDQAAVDYLIYGTRWGLTVPVSQMLRFFGPKSILWETGIVLLVSLLSLLVIVYSCGILISKFKYAPILIGISVISNSAFLFQFLNGGLSQAFALAGNGAIFLVITLILRLDFNFNKGKKYLSLILISIAGWSIINTTYIDAGIIIVGFIGLLFMLTFFFNRSAAKHLFLISFPAYILSLLITPTLSFAVISLFDLRLHAASGTGSSLSYFPLPSELLGFFDSLTQNDKGVNSLQLVLGIAISLFIFWKSIMHLRKSSTVMNEGLILISSLLMVVIGLLVSFNGKLQTNYIYTKIGVYLAPIIIIALYTIVVSPKGMPPKKKGASQTNYGGLIAGSLTILSLSTFFYSSSFLYKDGNNTSVRPFYGDLISNSKLVNQLSEFNYLIPYHQGYELLGVFGNVHWVSKATNDQLLDSRLEFPLRLMCFKSDSTCKPTTKLISNPQLEKFGIVQFESPITILEFSKLSIQERYSINFSAFNIPYEPIPSRMIGGNPYFNKVD